MIGLSLNDAHRFRNNIVCLDKSLSAPMVPSSVHFFALLERELFAGRRQHLHQMNGTFPSVMRWCGMNQNAAELRGAAASARAFADTIGSVELKRSFREMARRWEAEAEECETKEKKSMVKRSLRKTPTRKH
jgi:hypothetical protein